jgi:hypothetical protein
MEIDNYKVYDLEDSLVASGLPMQPKYAGLNFACETVALLPVPTNRHFSRACKLADSPIGSGHSNFLSGILVSANITATIKWWEQFQRYHFKQIVSSMSTMHRLRAMLIDGTARFHPLVDHEAIERVTQLARMGDGSEVSDEALAYTCPAGLLLTARITTNYLQLKTIYNQRHNHKLEEWHDFCAWIAELPFARELILCPDGEK